MKKAILILGWTLFTLTVTLPLGSGLCALFGYEFKLTSYTAFAVATMLTSIIMAILSIKTEDKINNIPISVMFCLLTPLSLINTFFYILEYIDGWVWISIIMLVCIVCCYYLTVNMGKPVILKAVSIVLSVISTLAVCYFGIFALFLSLIFGDIGQNTVIQSAKSPNERYCIEVIDSDQGALGGDTLVYLCDNREFNAIIFKITKKKELIYHGEWGEAFDMDVRWKDNHCVIIDSREYLIE